MTAGRKASRHQPCLEQIWRERMEAAQTLQVIRIRTGKSTGDRPERLALALVSAYHDESTLT
jgi:hypothetical protein